jgi:hypothetical protein
MRYITERSILIKLLGRIGDYQGLNMRPENLTFSAVLDSLSRQMPGWDLKLHLRTDLFLPHFFQFIIQSFYRPTPYRPILINWFVF